MIGHEIINESFCSVTFHDADVKPNDFYWIAVMQKGEMLSPNNNQYMAFLGPVFIDQVKT